MANDVTVKRIAELIDGDGWELADLLAEEFPPEEFGEAGDSANHDLYKELEQYETELAADYGIELKAATMRRYRSTALAWPRGARAPRASFDAHQIIRGEDREERMRRYLAEMKREGKHALSRRMVQRYRSSEGGKSKGAPPWETQVKRAVDSLARRLVLGNVKTDRADWWNAKAATARRRKVVVDALRALAASIEEAAG